jgi:hypothetical protein
MTAISLKTRCAYLIGKMKSFVSSNTFVPYKIHFPVHFSAPSSISKNLHFSYFLLKMEKVPEDVLLTIFKKVTASEVNFF